MKIKDIRNIILESGFYIIKDKEKIYCSKDNESYDENEIYGIRSKDIIINNYCCHSCIEVIIDDSNVSKSENKS